MTARRQWMVVAGIVAAATAGVWAGVHFLGDQFVQITVGSRAPDFAAVTLDSVPKQRTLADYKGQVTLVNVWATWCIPCEKEMPMLQRLYSEYKAKGLRIAAVSIDLPGMEAEIRRFTARYELGFDVLYDSDGKIKLGYMTTGVPESFLIGKDGVIRFKQISAINERDAAQIRALLDGLLAEPGG